MKTPLPLLFFLSSLAIHGQVPLDTAAVKSQLAEIFAADQGVRKNADSAKFWAFVDSSNLAQVETLITQYGWVGKSVIGPRGNYTLWLVIQHAPLEAQVKYFPLMEKSVAEGESRASELAYLDDRIRMRQGKPQRYGSQVITNPQTGAQEFYVIEDEEHVNERRAAAGLEPLEEYAQYFGIDYHLPKKEK